MKVLDFTTNHQIWKEAGLPAERNLETHIKHNQSTPILIYMGPAMYLFLSIPGRQGFRQLQGHSRQFNIFF